jgi:hypothetical protein
MRWLIGLFVVCALFAGFLAMRGGQDLPPGEVSGAQRPGALTEQRAILQRGTGSALGVTAPAAQILFGDLHVHTTYSIDAFLYALPLFAQEGGHPPADACDFARHCASLDFFSINDHAEGLTPERWRATIDTLRACAARAGNADDPDLVPFLGWEWTQVGRTPADHYGHKNVVIRGLGEDEIPARPIAYRPASDQDRAPPAWQLRVGEALASLAGPDYANFMWWLRRLLAMEACPEGQHTRALAPDCLESATTPRQLFDKLDEWGLDSLVIPHGLAWGIHAPPGARLDNQLANDQHDPARQRLLEVFSGHGNGERFRPWLLRPADEGAAALCPMPSADHLPCCWQAGEIMRARCGSLSSAECEQRVASARRLALEAGTSPHLVFPDTRVEDWLDCDECRDCFKPASTLRAGETAQYGAAISAFAPGAEGRTQGAGRRDRFRWGFIASSDNHRARSATGYKQFARTRTTDARGVRSPATDAWIRRLMGSGDVDPQRPQRVRANPRSFAALFDKERQASFMYPGGLVAVHAAGRDRDAIWDALSRKEVYGTSGPRILLYFDLLNGPGGRVPMGGEVVMSAAPRFAVRAAGALVQRPGCPQHAREGLGEDDLERLCLGECYHPGERRHIIDAIEVVRIRPQMTAGQPVDDRIDDPWKRFACAPDAAGCAIEFEDEDFVVHGGDAVYYVRALQEATPAINGDTLRPQRDASGRVIATEPCYGNYLTDEADDCLAAVRERAWSSPIYVDRGDPPPQAR